MSETRQRVSAKLLSIFVAQVEGKEDEEEKEEEEKKKFINILQPKDWC